jgi:hypothetical protein
MGILSGLAFWKKKDEFADLGMGDKENLAFGNDFNSQNPNLGADQFGQTPGMPSFGQDQGSTQGFGQQQYPQYSGYPSRNPSMPSYPSPQFSQQPSFQSPQQDMTSKNIEIISSKLDALRASIESMNQRLANLEAIARGEDPGRGRRYY